MKVISQANTITSEVVLVTPRIAQKWLDDGLYDRQRPLMERTVLFLTDEMEKGNFDQGTVFRFASYNGRDILIDGQHRSAAIIRCGKSQQGIIIRERVDSLDELAKLYSYIDIGKYRTWADVARALGRDTIDLNGRQLNALKAAFGLVYRGFMTDGIRESNIMMFEKTLEWQKYASLYFSLVDGAGMSISLPLKRKHMVALGISTLRFSNIKLPTGKSAESFWRQVSLDDGLRIKDPRKKLRERLIDSQIRSTAWKDKNVTAKQAFLYTVRAWNAYVDNEEVSILKLPKSSRIPVKYTPFDYSRPMVEYRKCFEDSYWGAEWIEQNS